MFVVPVIALVLILLWAAISPESMWSTTSAWQYRDPEANEPSDAAYAMQRVGAVLGLVLIAILVLAVVNRDPPKPAAPRPTWADAVSASRSHRAPCRPQAYVGRRHPQVVDALHYPRHSFGHPGLPDPGRLGPVR